MNMQKNEMMKLTEYKGVEFIGGQITSRIEANEKKGEIATDKILVVPPKAIAGGRIVHENLYELSIKGKVDEKKITKAGDIVVKLSTPYDAAYITEEDEGLLITSFCIIVRIKNKNILPQFLTTFFNSDVYLDQVKMLVSGATVPMLTIGKVKEVYINDFTLEEQQQIAIYYHNLCEIERTMKEIIVLEKEKINSVLGGNR